jgi:ribosome biogenesis GTPase
VVQRRELGWDDTWEETWADACRPGLVPARVTRIDKGGLSVDGADVSFGRQLIVAGKKARDAVVGDWCGLDPDTARIELRLPRRSVLERRSPGADRDDLALSAKAVAANLDHLLVLQPLDVGVNPARLVRELVIAWESGAQPAVVLTKSDQVDASALAEARAAAGAAAPGVDVVAVSNLTGHGLHELRPLLRPGITVALLGASGAGKSSLVNALAGRRVALTGNVRESDLRGRHTTVTGQLLALRDGGLLIDTPGIRGVGLWRAWDGLAMAFSDVESVADTCRFEDCAHTGEAGCSVVDAIEADRLELYRSLSAELTRLDEQLEIRTRDVQRETNQRSRRKAQRRRPPT